MASWGWLPLLTGLAVVDGIRAATDLETTLKWPNDVLALDGGKLGGILAERVDGPDRQPLVVVGIGLNVSSRPDELPVPTATSLVLAGAARSDRQTLHRVRAPRPRPTASAGGRTVRIRRRTTGRPARRSAVPCRSSGRPATR